ncbi:MAG: TraB/GumN family protein [Ferruginibacter sp.]
MKLRNFFILFYFTAISFSTFAQSVDHYSGLLWQITGNGLKKPSYLFGTMHVSSKLAFHLSDSFYYALKNVDAVALELNPDLWQKQMVRLNKLNENYSAFIQPAGDDYLTENTFRIHKFDKELKAALSTEPPVVNSLLYRSYKAKDDFEEDTFLDLYIFQTGRKLGKAAAGVEDYYESEKLVMEAYSDMAKEKKKKEIDLDGETMSSLVEKMQNAYRRADLDLMDSLDNAMEKSPAFREKFLYKRNEIQANAIDSIIKTTSLFAGVGAAHLPGDRGVIAMLRSKGYKLRPVKMSDRDARQKDEINQLKVPVKFAVQYADDGMYNVAVPGELYKINNDALPLDRVQYADMGNGAYYMVTRVKTNASILGTAEEEIRQNIDSLLYENIPGKILTKKKIITDGYTGFDLTNRTRRGDLQRYQVFNTPFEVLIFKMSGKNDYVNGAEANKFFSSIRLKKFDTTTLLFSPPQGGFNIKLPQEPHQYYNSLEDDRQEYESVDKNTGNAYFIIKKSIYNFSFLEEDSFDLSMIETSFRAPDYFDKQLSRKFISHKGYPALLVREKLKNGNILNVAYLIAGPHLYAFAKRPKNPDDSSFAYFNSVSIEPYRYTDPLAYTDTFLFFKTKTPVVPDIDASVRGIIEQAQKDNNNGKNPNGYFSYWQKPGRGIFRSTPTGELVSVYLQQYPQYYSVKDSLAFWQNEMDDYTGKGDMLIDKKLYFKWPDGTEGYNLQLRDTGSSRVIQRLIMLKGHNLYNLVTLTDTIGINSSFISSIFNNMKPLAADSQDMYKNKLDLFYDDLFSLDSTRHKKAQQAIANIYFGPSAVPVLIKSITRLSASDKDYLDTKAKLISELGYIKTGKTNDIPAYLKNLYRSSADTSLFQNEIINSLARLKTKEAYSVLKELLLQDPPIFENSTDYTSLFNNLEDSLQISASLFPDLLQLTMIDDYKEKLIDLLVSLVDSGYVGPKNYKQHFNSIYLDAKVALKKQRAKEQQQIKPVENNIEEEPQLKNYKSDNYSSTLNDYSILLIPFYHTEKMLKPFFEKLLQSSDEQVRLNTVLLMLRNNIPVADSSIYKLAAAESTRSLFYRRLKNANLKNKFPTTFNSPDSITRAMLIAANEYDKMDSLVFIKKISTKLKTKTGWVYFYKYRLKKTDDWKIAISGLQPANENETDDNDDLVLLTDKKIKVAESLDEQLNTQLTRLMYSLRKSSKHFYSGENNYLGYSRSDDDED